MNSSNPFTEPHKTSEALSDLFGLMSVERRRKVVWMMWSKSSSTTRELAKEIAAQEQDVAPDKVAHDDYHILYNNLSDHHLPALHDSGVIEYQGHTVRPGPHLQTCVVMLGVTRPIVWIFETD